VQGLLTISGDDHLDLVNLARTVVLEKVTGTEVTMHNQSRVRMKLGLSERQHDCQELVMVAVN
jgi:hypothetical protein